MLVNTEEIFGNQNQTGPHYEEDAEGQLTLIVEGQRVAEGRVTTRADALLLWAACFPVFNQKAPTRTAKHALAFVTDNVFGKGKGSLVVGNRALQRIVKLKQLIE